MRATNLSTLNHHHRFHHRHDAASNTLEILIAVQSPLRINATRASTQNFESVVHRHAPNYLLRPFLPSIKGSNERLCLAARIR